jgi:hypothetical protein
VAFDINEISGQNSWQKPTNQVAMAFLRHICYNVIIHSPIGFAPNFDTTDQELRFFKSNFDSADTTTPQFTAE